VRVLRPSNSVERVTHLCLKEDSEKAVTAVGYADGSVRLWNFEDGSTLMTLQGHRSAISCLSFNHAGHLLASARRGSHAQTYCMSRERSQFPDPTR
jgi:U3 small nucleolar RNA-associated protein 12